MKSNLSTCADARQDAWEEHLRDVLDELGIPAGMLADNLTSSVAAYCRSFHPLGVRSTELRLLIARAFCAVDDSDSAARILKSMEAQRNHVSRWLEILTELHHFPELLPYFSAGIIRPADWAGARLDRMWTLDFGRLALTDAERHELMLYRSVRVLIEKMLVFWDATRGEGILGLKSLSVMDVKKDAGGNSSAAACDELLGYIEGLFRQHAESRGWHAAPLLLNLDL